MHSFHHSQFSSLPDLLDARDRNGETVSLVIPALNEAATIGGIVSHVRRELVERAPLLEEIVVMDGSSDDATVERATEAGATVYIAEDILPGISVPGGKGTSMWKSLAVVKGSIVVFIDADIQGFGPHFVYGLVGPLLQEPSVHWAKAFYRRPFASTGEPLEGYGGRVTEILVRPLLSLWYPDLVAVNQPLSGECAFRTRTLKEIWLASGYGVEIQMLLGMYRAYGLSACAQVDMDVRHHRNRPVSQLGRMSFTILHTFMQFLQQDGRVSVPGELADQWASAANGGGEVVNDVLLPPMNSVAPG